MIETLFSTPLYYTKVDGFHNIQKEIEKGLDKLEFKYKKHWGETHLLAPHQIKVILFLKFSDRSESRCFAKPFPLFMPKYFRYFFIPENLNWTAPKMKLFTLKILKE